MTPSLSEEFLTLAKHDALRKDNRARAESAAAARQCRRVGHRTLPGALILLEREPPKEERLALAGMDTTPRSAQRPRSRPTSRAVDRYR